MMRYLRVIAACSVAVFVSAGVAVGQGQTPSATGASSAQAEIVLAQAKRIRHVGTHVYLLRGFMDIFSTGMDDLGAKLNRRGIRASVHGHAEYHNLAEGIASRYRAGQRENIVIIGHSLGANAAFQMAEALGQYKINVSLIIAYDPTAHMSVSSNVSRVVNFYASNNGWGVSVARGPGFRGSLSNVDLSRRGEMGHTDIDKSPSLHNRSISYIRALGGRRATKSTGTEKESKKSDGAKSKETAKAASTSGSSVPGPTANVWEKKELPETSGAGDDATGAVASKPNSEKSVTAEDSKPAAPEKPAAEDSSDGPKPEKTAASPASSSSN